MSFLQINCSLCFVGRCPTSLKLLWALPKYSHTAGPVLVPSCWKEGNSRQQQVHRSELNNHQETPWQPQGAMTCNARAGGEKGHQELGWSLRMLTITPADNSLHAYKELLEKGILWSIHQLRLGWGKTKEPCTLEHKIQGEEPLGKESRQTWKCRGVHGWPFGSVNPFCSLHAHEFVSPPGTGQLITQHTAAVLPSSALLQAMVSCTSFHGNQREKSCFPPKSHSKHNFVPSGLFFYLFSQACFFLPCSTDETEFILMTQICKA